MSKKPWREKYLESDPLTGIKSGLLNSQDIREYAKLGLLVSNFDEQRLKSASYEMNFLGELHTWDHVDGRPRKRTVPLIEEGKKVTLRRNSIIYISLKEEFRLPHYIAARFNLHIRHVHKGLLLGTGPLVDPGFDGRLLIPLHNLTENDYEIAIDDGLIWVEFTKLNAAADVGFPEEKLGVTPNGYFDKAGVLEKGGVLSSIETTLNASRNEAEAQSRALQEMKEKHENFLSKVQNIGLAGGAFGLIMFGTALAALLINAHQLDLTAQQLAAGSVETLQRAEIRLEEIEAIIAREALGNNEANAGVNVGVGGLAAQSDSTPAPQNGDQTIEAESPAVATDEAPNINDLEEPSTVEATDSPTAL